MKGEAQYCEDRLTTQAAALRESEERFRLVFENAPIGMVIADLKGRFTRVNQAMADILGYSAAELAGKNFAAVTHPEDLTKDIFMVGELVRGKKPRFVIDVAALGPDYVIISGGSNDAFHGVAAPEAAGNVAAMAAAARSCGIRPVIGLPPPVDYPEETLLAEYRSLLRAFAAESALPVIDFYAALVAPDGGLRPGLHTDGVHPNEDGYALMAAAAVAALAGITGA
jgi:hypothetical protein